MAGLKVALVQDLLVSYGGSEQVLFDLHGMFPSAPIFTTIFDPSRLPPRFAELPVRTSFLQQVPSLSRNYAAVVPLMPLAFSRFDLRGFDVVISSAHAFAKSVRVPDGTLHLCYCHTPLRYAWSHQDDYLARMPARRLLEPVGRAVLDRLRRWDYQASVGVDCYVANSENVRRRIADFYGRPAEVVYPAVDLSRFARAERVEADAGFLVVSRLFAYKRVHVAVEACTALGLPLTVVGRGPELNRLRAIAGPTVSFLGEVDDAALEAAYRRCAALVFTADEDFGLVPLEAMASGRPVLALDLGGARETVVAGVTGEFYADAGVEALVDALRTFRPSAYDPDACRRRAGEFSPARFRAGISRVLERELGRAVAERAAPV